MAVNMILIGFAVAFIVMLLMWLVQLRTGNAGIVDIAWSYNFAFIALVYFLLGDGFYERKLLMLLMVLFWSLRLGTYLFIILKRRTGDTGS
jgi:steroid 5-alpha reductase family enzyme